MFEMMVAMIVASLAGAGVSAVNAKKARKSQEKMQKTQLAQQKKESALAREAGKETRTPPAPKQQQLAVQAAPKTPKRTRGSLAIRSRGGKGGLRVGSGGQYGARVA